MVPRWLAALLAVVVALGACASRVATHAPGPSSRRILVVAAESQYGDVAGQIGGASVRVVSVESNPASDPHGYEVSATVAADVAGARLVVQNGLGYDAFMGRLEAAAPDPHRRVIDVQHLLRLPDSTPNPHLWYSPATMPAVAAAIAADLSAIDPAGAAGYRSALRRFDASLAPWRAAIASFREAHAGTTAAVTEPVADALLQAMGFHILTPFRLQADVMNGVDPTPQDLDRQRRLVRGHLVHVLVYNSQVVDAVTAAARSAAARAGVPLVGVQETMPPGEHYQRWMLATTAALAAAATGSAPAP